MLFEKRVIHKLLNRSPIIRVLLQATIQKVPDLGTHKEIGRDFDFVLDYFDEFLFSSDFEGVLANYHLIHHDSDGPNVYLLIILSAFQNLGTNVQWSAAKGCPKFVVLVN